LFHLSQFRSSVPSWYQNGTKLVHIYKPWEIDFKLWEIVPQPWEFYASELNICEICLRELILMYFMHLS